MPGDFEELLDQKRVEDDCTYVTVADHNIALVEKRAAAKPTKRTRTYHASEMPVRPCTDSCPVRATCRDFLSGSVEDGDPCKPGLREITKWKRAYRKGQLDTVKADVGVVTGAMMGRLKRMLEKIDLDGDMIEVTKYTNSGIKYTEKIAHPLLKEVVNIIKVLGTPDDYLMTPKSQKESGPQQHLHLTVTPEEVNARFAARFRNTDERADDS